MTSCTRWWRGSSRIITLSKSLNDMLVFIIVFNFISIYFDVNYYILWLSNCSLTTSPNLPELSLLYVCSERFPMRLSKPDLWKDRFLSSKLDKGTWICEDQSNGKGPCHCWYRKQFVSCRKPFYYEILMLEVSDSFKQMVSCEWLGQKSQNWRIHGLSSY